MRTSLLHVLVAVSFVDPSAAHAQNVSTGPSGDSVIRAPAEKSEIVITTTSRLAGAIHSLTWNGKEFIDSADHGRQLQSAANFDLGRPFIPEVFNPTEAGSRADGAGDRSSSRLLALKADRNVLETTTQMAFWLAPGEKSEGHAAYNDRVLSNHMLKKRVQIGVQGLPQVIQYEVRFTMPADEKHKISQFEALTGYMPPDFEKFWALDVKAARWISLDDGPGEQPRPVALATADGRFAMGVISPEPCPDGSIGPGYGRFRFRDEEVVKWNCVFRVHRDDGVPPGDCRYRMFVAVGTLDDVRQSLLAVNERFRASR